MGRREVWVEVQVQGGMLKKNRPFLGASVFNCCGGQCCRLDALTIGGAVMCNKDSVVGTTCDPLHHNSC
jgi:hypothetical protein